MEDCPGGPTGSRCSKGVIKKGLISKTCATMTDLDPGWKLHLPAWALTADVSASGGTGNNEEVDMELMMNKQDVVPMKPEAIE